MPHTPQDAVENKCCKKCEDWSNDGGRQCAHEDCKCHKVPHADAIEKVLQLADEHFAWRLSSKTDGKIDNSCLMDIKSFLRTALLQLRKETIEECEKERWEQSCEGCGHHDSMWKTLVTSPQWKEWCESQIENTTYDTDEARVLGVMGKKHFEDFMKYFRRKAIEDCIAEVDKMLQENNSDVRLTTIWNNMKDSLNT